MPGEEIMFDFTEQEYVDTTPWSDEVQNIQDKNKEQINDIQVNEVVDESPTCPNCWKWVIKQNSKAMGCTNYQEGCKFTIWNTTAWHTFTDEEKAYMITNKRTNWKIKFMSKAWKEFNALMIFDKDKWFQFDFWN